MLEKTLDWGLLLVEFVAILIFLIEAPRQIAGAYRNIQNW